jgi:hypothetical protein
MRRRKFRNRLRRGLSDKIIVLPVPADCLMEIIDRKLKWADIAEKSIT